MTSSVQRVAHRGGASLAPENTLAAFQKALTLPIDTVEIDVHMSRDGHAIVFHDNTLERLTDGTGNILDLDFAYLRSLNAAAKFEGGWPEPQQIPTLREVLDLLKGRVRLYIEIKASRRDGVPGRYPDIAETVVNEVRAAGIVDQTCIISFDWPILGVVKSLEPGLETGAIITNSVVDARTKDTFVALLERMKALQCSWIAIDERLYTRDLLTAIHEYGFKCNVWTINTLPELQRFASAGADSLTTDRPDLFSQL